MSQMHIETYGQGQALVLVHGWAMHSGIWRDFARELGSNFHVICVDLPGHGLSAKAESFTLPVICEWLAEEFDGQRLHWLGWSLGGLVMLEMAQRFPLLVDSMILLAGNPKFVQDAGWPGVPESVLDQFAENLIANPELTLKRFLSLQVKHVSDFKTLSVKLKRALDDAPVPDVDVLLSGLDILKNTDFRSFVKNLELPVLVILGEKDTLIPAAMGPVLKALNPGMNVSVIPGSGHAPFLSHQQSVIKKIMEFTA